MTRAAIDIPQVSIADFCRRHHVRRLSLFGSVLRDDFRGDSDIDVLVEFEPGHVPGYIRLGGMQHELTQLFGRMVDLKTPEELNRSFRDQVLATAEVQYADQ